MSRFLRRRELDAFVTHGSKVYTLEQLLPLSQEHRRNRNVQLIDEARTKILLDRVWSPADAHVQPVGCLARLVERFVNALRDKVERCSAFHLNGRA